MGTFSTNSADGYGRLNGTVALIPFLRAPGFIKAIACQENVPVGRFHGGVCHKLPTFPDISAQSRFVIRARSNTPGFQGFKFSFNSYKADFNVTSEWSDILLPFTAFSKNGREPLVSRRRSAATTHLFALRSRLLQK